jgi:hypothetical protein
MHIVRMIVRQLLLVCMSKVENCVISIHVLVFILLHQSDKPVGWLGHN